MSIKNIGDICIETMYGREFYFAVDKELELTNETPLR